MRLRGLVGIPLFSAVVWGSGQTYSLQSLAEHIRVHTHADTEVTWQAKKSSWHDRCFVLRPQSMEKRLDVSIRQAQNCGGAKFGPRT